MELSELLAAFDAELTVTGARWDGSCPVCGAATSSRRNGAGVRLCRPCTEAETGEPADELAARVSRKLSRRAYLALPRDADGRPILPALSWRDWRKLTS